MANLPIYNPTAEEGLSAPLGGLSQTLTNVVSALNLKTNIVTDLPLNNIFISESDLNRLYKAPLPYNVWLENPAPVIKKNGIVINPSDDGFKIHLMGGLVEFTSMLPNERPLNTDVLTVTATYVTNESSKLETVDGNIEVLTQKIANFRGVYTTKEQLENAIAEPVQNDFALVTGVVNDWFVWDNVNFEWLGTDELTLNKKADKKVPVTAGNVATLDEQGNLVDGGKLLSELLPKTGDGKDVTVSEITTQTTGEIEPNLPLKDLFGRVKYSLSQSQSGYEVFSFDATLYADAWNANQEYIFTNLLTTKNTEVSIAPRAELSAEQITAFEQAIIYKQALAKSDLLGETNADNGLVVFKSFGTKPTIDIPVTITLTGVLAPHALRFIARSSFGWDIDYYSGLSGIIEYSTDGQTWTEYTNGQEVNGSNVYYIRGTDNNSFFFSVLNAPHTIRFKNTPLSGISIIGDIRYLLDWQTVASGGNPPMGDKCFNGVFFGAPTNLLPSLPSQNITNQCYEELFAGTFAEIASSTSDSDYYIPWRVPTNFDFISPPSSWGNNMFMGTRGTFTGTPQEAETYWINPTRIKTSGE